MRIFITGGAGYIGMTLTEMLLERGYDVIVLDALLYGDEVVNHLISNKRCTVIKGDTRFFNPSIMVGVDAVVDLAAISQPDPYGRIPEESFLEINYRGSTRVAGIAKKHGVEKYIFASTCSVYGASLEPVDETSHPMPLEPYAKSKMLAEHEITKMANKHFCPTILRFATCYGLSRKMRFDLVVNSMTLALFKEGRIKVGRPGTQIRPVVHVKDAARAVVTVIEFADTDKISGEIFNVGSNEQVYQIKELANVIGKAIGRNYEIEYYGDPDLRNYIVRFDKIRRILNFEVKYSVTNGAIEIYRALEGGIIKPEPKHYVIDWIAKLVKEGKL